MQYKELDGVDVEVKHGYIERMHSSTGTLFAIAVSMLGISFCWGCQFARASATFQALGIESQWIGVVWLAGPLSGILVAPCVGIASDYYGARKPFVLLGLIGIVISFSLFSFSTELGYLLGDRESDQKHTKAIILAGVLFWCADMSINVIQAAIRALLVDLAGTRQQSVGSSMLSVMQGVGNLLIYLIGGHHVGKWFPFLKFHLASDFLWDVRTMYILGVVVCTLCVCCTLVFVKETSITRSGSRSCLECTQTSLIDVDGVSTAEIEGSEDEESISFSWNRLPRELRGICLLQVFVWYNWFCFLVFIVPYVGSVIFKGDPTPPNTNSNVTADPTPHKLFDQGVQLANTALALNSLVSLVFSVLIPKLSNIVGSLKRMYLVCIILQLILTMWLAFAKTSLECLIVISLLGIPWAGSLVLPYSMAGEACIDVGNRGFCMAVLNVFICIPQILVSLSSTLLIHVGIRWLFGASVISLFIACIGEIYLIRKQRAKFEIHTDQQ